MAMVGSDVPEEHGEQRQKTRKHCASLQRKSVGRPRSWWVPKQFVGRLYRKGSRTPKHADIFFVLLSVLFLASWEGSSDPLAFFGTRGPPCSEGTKPPTALKPVFTQWEKPLHWHRLPRYLSQSRGLRTSEAYLHTLHACRFLQSGTAAWPFSHQPR